MSFSFASTAQTEDIAPPKRKTSRAAMHVEHESAPVGVHGSTSGNVLQRKAGCACGGGCPRCEARSSAHGLDVSQPGDALELEADRVAERVMRLPAHGTETSGRNPAPAATPLVQQALGSQGQPLDTATRHFFEARFGRDFGDVRIHNDPGAAESAQAVNAQAYTVGRNVVFGQDKYRPQTDEGKLLLAHELAHVVQQSAHGSRLQRREDKPKEKKQPFKGTAGSAPKLELDNSATTPCACLMVIHNNEKNARRTAEAIHKNCSYNLLLLNPNDGERRLSLPGHTETTDPNELFTPKVAEDCVRDEKQCEAFVKANSGTSNPALVEEVMGKQFFLAISKCSNTFALPVVALHNNVIEDTAKYREKIAGGTPVNDLKMDIDKTDPVAGEQQLKKLRDLIDTKFGKDIIKKGKRLEDKTTGEVGPKQDVTMQQYMMNVKGKTNIFRWCEANPLSKCHIGDPNHPDNVIWVTNEDDYAKLRVMDVNVALQIDLSRVVGTDAESDLSTLFLFIKKIKGDILGQSKAVIDQQVAQDLKDIDDFEKKLLDAIKAGTLTNQDLAKGMTELVPKFSKLITDRTAQTAAKQAIDTQPQLHFVNIETQDSFPGKSPADVRVESYEAIINVLKALNLHCCGTAAETAKAETDIKESLKARRAP